VLPYDPFKFHKLVLGLTARFLVRLYEPFLSGIVIESIGGHPILQLRTAEPMENNVQYDDDDAS